MKFHRGKIIGAVIRNESQLISAENKYRKYPLSEAVPYAVRTSYRELCSTVFPDHDGPGIINPLYVIVTNHITTIGVDELGKKAYAWLNGLKNTGCPIDVISVCAGLDGDRLALVCLYRSYDTDRRPDFTDLFVYLNETGADSETEEDEEAQDYTIAALEKQGREESKPAARDPKTERSRRYQDRIYQESGSDVPFLNRLDYYVLEESADDGKAAVYQVDTVMSGLDIILPYDRFTAIFRQAVSYLTSTEKNAYIEAIRKRVNGSSEDSFDMIMDHYIDRNFIRTGILPVEDSAALKKRLNNALFDLYIIQDLITANPEITDIKITAPDSIRFRMYGKAYTSNLTFIDEADYLRFVEGLALKNRIDISIPTQTFTDVRDPEYILRFTITAGYITGSGYPIVHIRKVARKKRMAPELIAAGMFDEKVRDFLIDCARHSRGVVFAGPPGSGKTTILNWFLEQYEDSAEVLVIQDNDELFSNRKGMMIEHVITNPRPGETACTLEDLGKMALVSGCNVFVIGEARDGIICSAITLSNAGCRTAITIHSPSAEETIDKMCDLALRGFAESYDMAKRMLKSFQHIVYLRDYKVVEITEIVRYSEDRKDMIYKPIYRRDAL